VSGVRDEPGAPPHPSHGGPDAEVVASGQASAVEVAQAHLDRIAAVDPALHAFLHIDSDGALAAAGDVDRPERPRAALAAGRRAARAEGRPHDAGRPTTCGSRILQGWKPPYDATVTRRLKEAGVVILGKTNMDEFAMGSSTEHSAYGPTRNPWTSSASPWLGRRLGGRRRGVRGAARHRHRHRWVGRQPAAVTGTVGVKPTYGGVSRYGW